MLEGTSPLRGFSYVRSGVSGLVRASSGVPVGTPLLFVLLRPSPFSPRLCPKTCGVLPRNMAEGCLYQQEKKGVSSLCGGSGVAQKERLLLSVPRGSRGRAAGAGTAPSARRLRAPPRDTRGHFCGRFVQTRGKVGEEGREKGRERGREGGKSGGSQRGRGRSGELF